MRLANFKIESLGYETFEGYTKDEDWNGWDCPYFTFEQAQKILKTYNMLRSIIRQKELAYYDSATDGFIFPATMKTNRIFSRQLMKPVKRIIPSVLFVGFGKKPPHDKASHKHTYFC